MSEGPDLLRTIVAATRRTTAVRREREPIEAVAARADQRRPQGERFRTALGMPGRINVIAECKRRSPSKGVLLPRYDPVQIAQLYERSGAAAISVLTEPSFFDGSLEHLAAVRAAVQLPLLRKDFIVEEYQLFEARAAGADAILLIVGALGQQALLDLRQSAESKGMAALVEVHNEEELSRALDSGAGIIGVNNRDLHTLRVEVGASSRLAARIPSDIIAVSESGLKSRRELDQLAAQGYKAFLIGERFMTDPDPAGALGELLTSQVST
jgi:indole-3-glycerol phosphate synthase